MVIVIMQNASYDKKDPSSGSWDYIYVMKELAKQSSNIIR